MIPQIGGKSKDPGSVCGEFASARFNSFSRGSDCDLRSLLCQQASGRKADSLRAARASNQGHFTGKVHRCDFIRWSDCTSGSRQIRLFAGIPLLEPLQRLCYEQGAIVAEHALMVKREKATPPDVDQFEGCFLSRHTFLKAEAAIPIATARNIQLVYIEYQTQSALLRLRVRLLLRRRHPILAYERRPGDS